MSAHTCSIPPQENVQGAFSTKEFRNGLPVSSRDVSDFIWHWLTIQPFNIFFLIWNYFPVKHTVIRFLAFPGINEHRYIFQNIWDQPMNQEYSWRETPFPSFKQPLSDRLLLIAQSCCLAPQCCLLLPHDSPLFQRFQTTSLGIKLFVGRKISCLRVDKAYTNHSAASPCYTWQDY